MLSGIIGECMAWLNILVHFMEKKNIKIKWNIEFRFFHKLYRKQNIAKIKVDFSDEALFVILALGRAV